MYKFVWCLIDNFINVLCDTIQIFNVFRRLSKIAERTTSIVMSVRHFRMEQRGSRLGAFHEVWFQYIFRQSIEKFRFH
jgi:hypothetical protein